MLAWGTRVSSTSTPGRAVRGQKSDREMFRVPCGRVDRFLHVHLAMNVPKEELRRPLVLLVAAGRAPREIGFAVAQRERRAERRAWTFAGRKPGRMFFVEPERLRSCA